MARHAMLPKGMLELFDFAAMNPIQGPLMTSQMAMPAVLLHSLEHQEREMRRIGEAIADDAEKVAQEHHEEKQTVTTEEASETQEISTSSFSLVYYNPELDEVQVIKDEVKTNISDYSQKQKPGQPAPYAAQTAMALDQSVGQKSTYPLYRNIATPIAREVVDPVRLEIALSRIEVESPKPFGGAAGIIIKPQVFDKVEHQIEKEGIKEEIVAVQALKEVENERAETLHQVDSQIKQFEHVIEELEVTDVPMKDLVKELPPLSKERYLTLLKEEKKIAETLVVDMLIADLEFLLAVKKRLKKMGLRDLLDTIKKMGKIPGLAGITFREGGGDDDEEDEEE
ncbi:hypothetical protein GF412_00435 [Candidatus Micrarchaeota archaeon]|nr:hypothetical protein [Candidatus Micrarchaeota archaeon]MBD3417442.1 hypothetical protein [Candidatus Micrarchaeota archaeon]